MTLTFRLPTWHGWGLLLPIAPLCAFGLLSIQATGDVEPGRWLTRETQRQLACLVLGTGGMFAALAVGYHRLARLAFVGFWVGVAMLAYIVMDRWVDVPLVEVHRKVRRWIRFGPVEVQISEVMKIAYVLALAAYLRWRRNYRTLKGLIVPFALTLIPMTLIKMQPDLGTTLLFLPVLFAMLFAAGAKGRHLGVILLLAFAALPFFWFKIETFQRLRITSVFLQSPRVRAHLENHPALWDSLRPAGEKQAAWFKYLHEWENGSGYQLVQSKTAVGSGGLLGQGFGQGRFCADDTLLPENHNDFIFAMIAYQWGLWGGLLVVLCYAVMVVIGMDVATCTRDPFGRLVAVGFATLFGVQTLTNLCMTIGIGPVTGVTLPFVSAGGSSLVASFISVGLVMSVAQHRPVIFGQEPFSFDEESERYQT
ncbi:MAG: FtsW/RodA/SpoVE family cell cycle protein [Phycisphaerae bacterium]|jgi:cell division protein FtsW (lipid II flippase)